MAEKTLDWQSYYIMSGGAAAALTGLVFIAISLHAKVIMADAHFKDRAFTSVASLMTQVFLAAAMLAPGQSHLDIGFEVELVAAFFLARTIIVVRHRLMDEARAQLPLFSRAISESWGLAESVGWSLWLALLVACGIDLIADSRGGFYLLALAMVYMFAATCGMPGCLLPKSRSEG